MHALALILFAVWLLGFSFAVAITISGYSEITHASGRRVTSSEKVFIISIGCLLWFVFFLPPVIAILKRKD